MTRYNFNVFIAPPKPLNPLRGSLLHLKTRTALIVEMFCANQSYWESYVKFPCSRVFLSAATSSQITNSLQFCAFFPILLRFELDASQLTQSNALNANSKNKTAAKNCNQRQRSAWTDGQTEGQTDRQADRGTGRCGLCASLV